MLVPPLLMVSVPATSAVPKSTASVVEPEPWKMEAVKVLETIASVTELAGRVKPPAVRVRPLLAVSNPEVVMVLLVSVSVPALVARVPEVGKVTLVVPVVVRVKALAPAVVKLPPKVRFVPAPANVLLAPETAKVSPLPIFKEPVVEPMVSPL